MKVKICGLTRMEDIEFANQAKPAYIGFVFAPSRRQVTIPQANIMKEKLNPEILAVGVFVNQDRNQIAKLLQDGIIDVAQLHGQETESDIQFLQKTGKPVIKAVSVTTWEDIAKWQDSTVEYLLLDQGKGGTGQAFDWNILQGREVPKPYFLAGGLTPDNIPDTTAFALDVSSGVETNGVKDFEKIQQFMKNALTGRKQVKI